MNSSRKKKKYRAVLVLVQQHTPKIGPQGKLLIKYIQELMFLIKNQIESYTRYKQATCGKHWFHIQNPGNIRNLKLTYHPNNFLQLELAEDRRSIREEFIS